MAGFFDDLYNDFNPRSREGSDDLNAAQNILSIKFQSALPRGERPEQDRSCSRPLYFNPRSREGSDLFTLIFTNLHAISIRAPARGATHGIIPQCTTDNDFNPRSREGSDLTDLHTEHVILISIRAPARGATLSQVIERNISRFQSALPRGERHYDRQAEHIGNEFQSALPRGERQSADILPVTLAKDFNPRSREGSDVEPILLVKNKSNFNPRSREGSDPAFTDPRVTSDRFQSALPRGERRSPYPVTLSTKAFQSALPRGERQDVGEGITVYRNFNPRSREGSDFVIWYIYYYGF